MRMSLLLPLLGLGLGGAPASRVVQVVATDYALQAQDSVPAGVIELAFANRGHVPHEVVVGLLRAGAGSREMVDAGQKNLRLREAPDHYLDGPPFGVLFAWPGQTSPAHMAITVRRGQRYALLCTLRDSLSAPQHAAMGMVRVLVVR